MVLTKLFADFFRSERAGGFVLIACTIISLCLTNIYAPYHEFWRIEVGNHTITHWINDGLMTIFFLLIGLELEREVYIGELSSAKNAMLPVAAALGGMIGPALLYLAFNTEGNARGFGIPMATDIAFAIGILSLLGSRVPTALKVFVTALAVIDDLGAILVIAVFYTSSLNWLHLGLALGILGLLFVLNRLRVYVLSIYLVAGGVAWYFMLSSGVHATLTGVLLAFVIPFGNGDSNSISYRLQHHLHWPVAFVILPLFALANTSVLLPGNILDALLGSVSIGILVGLVVGKPLGIFSFSFLAVKSGICSLPAGSKWSYIFGAGMLGGIGFTMSIFITLLAFEDPTRIDQAKIAIMVASFIAGVSGLLYLRTVLPKPTSSN
ncbi:MAG TPA: Na+/H+ antiporter NhaA [Chryseosolibacter sp.]